MLRKKDEKMTKINGNTVMCWYTGDDMKTTIDINMIDMRKVSYIVSKMDNLSTVRALTLNGDGFKQYCKIDNALYLYDKEAKKVLKKKMAEKKELVKQYLLSQGFGIHWNGDFIHGSNVAGNNVLELAPLARQDLDLLPWIKYVIASIGDTYLYIHFYRQDFSLDENGYIEGSWNSFLEDRDDEFRSKRYWDILSKKGFEAFKKEWEEYLATLDDELKKAREKLSNKLSLTRISFSVD